MLCVKKSGMDLISGIAVVTGVFLIAIAIVAHSVARIPLPDNQTNHDLVEQFVNRRSRTTFATLLIGFFVGLADVLVAAQLPAIAFMNVVVGAAAIAILYSTSRRRHTDDDNWRR